MPYLLKTIWVTISCQPIDGKIMYNLCYKNNDVLEFYMFFVKVIKDTVNKYYFSGFYCFLLFVTKKL